MMQAPSPSTGASPESLIAREDTFEGQLRTTTGVRVLGTVRGTIESERSVRIEEGAHVEADITAEEVVIAGTYSGNLHCRNRAEVSASGRVTGKIETAKIYLHEGGFFDGELRMRRGNDEPARPAEQEAFRARRTRYVDLANEGTSTPADKPAEPAPAESGES